MTTIITAGKGNTHDIKEHVCSVTAQDSNLPHRSKIFLRERALRNAYSKWMELGNTPAKEDPAKSELHRLHGD